MRSPLAVRPLVAAALLSAAASAFAQAKPPARTTAPAPTPAPATAPAPPPERTADRAADRGAERVVVERAAPAPAPAAEDRETDGEKAMGGYALVVFNTQPFDFANSGGAAPIPLTVYTVGLRHWTTQPWNRFRNWGVDLGVGLAVARTSVTQPQTGQLVTSDGASVTGFGLHAGLPLAVKHHKHATFEVVPELDLVYAKETIPAATAGGDATRYSGWSVRMGARAGFEIFFGFVGLPQLAVEASLGATIRYDSLSSKVGPSDRSTRTWSVATLRGSEPWSIFSGSVAAMYHF